MPKLSEKQGLHCALTPTETVFAESYFGLLTDTLEGSRKSMPSLRGAMVAAVRHNNAFDVPMLGDDVEAFVAEALRFESNAGTRKQLRAHTRRKRRAHNLGGYHTRTSYETGSG